MAQDAATSADVARDQLSSQQTSVLGTVQPEAGKLKVFISYSRKDLQFVDWLLGELNAQGFEAYLDKKDIAPGEPWKERIGKLILAADTIVFVLSPDSIGSDICAWEIAETERLSKRLLPIVWRPVDELAAPPALARLNWIFCNAESVVGPALEALARALKTDIAWVREHTRLGEAAARWNERGRPEALLLRGNDLEEGETWATRRPREAPDPTDTQLVYIEASRAGALASAQRERRRNRLITAGSLAATAVVSVLGWIFYDSSQEALRSQSLFLADLAQQQLKALDPETAALLALEGLRDEKSDDLTQRLRPYVPEAAFSLDRAWRAPGWLRARFEGHQTQLWTAEFSADGARALTASHDRTVLWDVASGKEIFRRDGNGTLSSNGQRVLTFGQNRAARIWDTVSGKEIAHFDGYDGFVTSAVFAHGGTRVLTVTDKHTGWVWDAATGKEIARLVGHQGSVVSAVFSTDGARVLTASWDHTSRLWDAATGKEIARFAGHDGSVASAVFSADEARVLTASWDRTARLWDVETGKEIGRFNGHQSEVTSAVFSPDGTRVLTASVDSTARLWETSTGKELARFEGHQAEVWSAVFSAGGSRVLTASSDKTARLWDVVVTKEFSPTDATGRQWDVITTKEIARLEGHEEQVISAVFSPDDRLALTASFDTTARLWVVAGGQETSHFEDHKDVVWDAVYSPDGARVLTASLDMTARQLDVASGKVITRFEADPNDVHRTLHTPKGEQHTFNAVYSPNGARVLTLSSNETARLWDAATGKLTARFDDLAPRSGSVVFSSDGARALTAHSGATTRLWDAMSGNEVARFHGSAVFSSDGARLLVFAADRSARLFEAASGKEIARFEGHQDIVLSAVFSPDGKHVLTASADKTVRLWQGNSGKEIARFEGHDRAVLSVKFSPDGTRAISTSADKTARVWNVADHRQTARLEAHQGSVLGAVFSNDGERVLTASDDGTERLWVVASGKEIARIEVGRAEDVGNSIFSPDGRYVLTTPRVAHSRLIESASGKEIASFADGQGFGTASFSADGTHVLTAFSETAHVWESASGKKIARLEGHRHLLRSAVFSPDGTGVLTASHDKTARVWQLVSWQDLAERVKQSVSRCLTSEQRQSFHLSPHAPRWCYTMKKSPYADKPPPPLWYEWPFVAARDQIANWSNVSFSH